MKKQLNYKNYLLEKCLIGCGIMNWIINTIIFYAMEAKHPDAIFDLPTLLVDFGITSIILGMVLVYYVTSATKKDIVNSKVDVNGNEYNTIVLKLPNKKFVMALSIGIIAMVITLIAVAVVSIILPRPLNVKQAGIFKGFACFIAGCVSGYLAINKVVCDMESEISVAA